MKIGNAQNFTEKQMSKVEQRKEEEKKIKKGIYQMQVMLDSQSMETLMKECDKAEAKRSGEKTERKDTGTESKESKKTDAQTEMEKMLSTARKAASLTNAVV